MTEQIATQWREVKVSDVAKVITGKTPPTARKELFGNEYPFITPTDIDEARMFCDAERKLSGKGRDYQASLLLPAKSICFTSIASVGKICITDEPSFTNQQINSLVAKDGVADYRFLYYALKYYTPALKRLAGGTMTSIINKTQFENFTFLLPALSEQESIGDMLFVLDNKIELLRKQNETLEQIARVIFNENFTKKIIDGKLPKGWKIGKLGEEFEIIMGQSPKGETFNERGEGMIFFQGRTDFGSRFPKVRLYTTAPTRVAEPLDVLISVRAPVGDINVAIERCCLGRGLGAVRSKTKSYALYKVLSLQRQIRTFDAEGTVFGSVSKADLSNIEVFIPTEDEVVRFEGTASPVDQKILLNAQNIRALEMIRDTLLPRLMSGTLKVSN